MSSTIEYRHVALKVDTEMGLSVQQSLAGFTADEYAIWQHKAPQFLVFCERGCSNTTDHSGRLARYWDIQCFGSDVICQAIRRAEYLETGVLRVNGKARLTPEGYISFYRRLLAGAKTIGNEAPMLTFELDPRLGTAVSGYEHLHRRVVEHSFTEYLTRNNLLTTEEISRYGSKSIRPVLRVVGDRDTFLACVTWLLDVAGYTIADVPMFTMRTITSSGWLEKLLRENALSKAA